MATPVSALTVHRSPVLGDVSHAFLGRTGGVSKGLYASLNAGLGSGDNPAAVRENRARALAAIDGADALVTVRQVHGARTVEVACPILDDERPGADAMVSWVPGLALGVLTADCAPVLLADARAKVIGAAHAGWKGAVGGVIESVVSTMEEYGAERRRIVAAVGPCIAQPSYEVGPEFEGRVPPEFLSAGAKGRFQFDLPGFVAHQLRAAGVTIVDAAAPDTYTEPERWFSYRRTTHAGEADYGRQLSIIRLG
ncbi:MAG: peptidoglycan editing factor PgeF [Sphingomonadaceae bacterium]|nr:peptidoglycan editing factor PgeF [Sphingomonadaceae bacterium]